MQVGLMWYDDDPKRAVEEKIRQAAERYREKHGRWPNTCYVHAEGGSAHVEDPGGACDPRVLEGGIRLVRATNILRHHYWLGESREKTVGKGSVVGNWEA